MCVCVHSWVSIHRAREVSPSGQREELTCKVFISSLCSSVENLELGWPLGCPALRHLALDAGHPGKGVWSEVRWLCIGKGKSRDGWKLKQSTAASTVACFLRFLTACYLALGLKDPRDQMALL